MAVFAGFCKFTNDGFEKKRIEKHNCSPQAMSVCNYVIFFKSSQSV